MFLLFNGLIGLKNGLKRFASDEDAPTMAEYGLLVVVIALVVIVGAAFFGTGLNTMFNSMGAAMNGASMPSIP